MSEGMASLNQHVVADPRWGASDRAAVRDGRSRLDLRPGLPLLPSAHARLDEVLRAVEADILPRLLLSRRDARPHDGATAAPDEAEVLRFATILLAHGDEAAAPRFVDEFRARGASVEDVYLRLFQPAARHIGELWLADLCSFVDVTLALGTLQRQVRDLSPTFLEQARTADAARLALLVPLPGDQHTFGLSIVAEFFRRSAWTVWSAPFRSRDELACVLRETWFTVVGFSISCAERLEELAAAITVVRRESCNAAVGVLVGGPVFVDHPDYVARVGADVMGLDARHAVFQAEAFASQLAER